MIVEQRTPRHVEAICLACDEPITGVCYLSQHGWSAAIGFHRKGCLWKWRRARLARWLRTRIHHR